MHQHRGLGVPVRLGTDVDAGDDDVDLAAVLGELDDPPQDAADPVHVLGAAVHRDERAGGNGKPLERHVHLFGEVEGGVDATGTRARTRLPMPRVGSPRMMTRAHAFRIPLW